MLRFLNKTPIWFHVLVLNIVLFVGLSFIIHILTVLPIIVLRLLLWGGVLLACIGMVGDIICYVERVRDSDLKRDQARINQMNETYKIEKEKREQLDKRSGM